MKTVSAQLEISLGTEALYKNVEILVDDAASLREIESELEAELEIWINNEVYSHYSIISII